MSQPTTSRMEQLEETIASGQRLARYWWGQGDCNFACAHLAAVVRARAELDRLRGGLEAPADDLPGYDDILTALELLRLRRA